MSDSPRPTVGTIGWFDLTVPDASAWPAWFVTLAETGPWNLSVARSS